MSAADSATWSGYGSPSATTRDGRLWAVKNTTVRPGRSGPGAGKEASASRVRSARSEASPGARCHEGMGVNATGSAACAVASRARRRYSPDPRDDWWGVSTMATTRSTPASSRSATASSMLGEVCLAPYRTRYSPGATASRTAASPSTWVRVRSASGDVPPMAW